MQVEERFVRDLNRKLNLRTGDVARMALTVLNWAADEARNGRVILSSRPDGTEIHRLAMPGLDPHV